MNKDCKRIMMIIGLELSSLYGILFKGFNSIVPDLPA